MQAAAGRGVSPLPGEISQINNRAVVEINGVRDRLRVLLISGEPHPGERVWRRLLTSRGVSPSCRMKRRHKSDEFGLQHDVAVLVNSYRRVVA